MRVRAATYENIWVPEGNLAEVFGCHEMALELVSGADFWCKLMFRASPGDLRGPAHAHSMRVPPGEWADLHSWKRPMGLPSPRPIGLGREQAALSLAQLVPGKDPGVL